MLFLVTLYFLTGMAVFFLPALIEGFWERTMEGIQYTDHASDRAWTPETVAQALSDMHQFPTVVLMWPVLLVVAWKLSKLRLDAEWLKEHLDEAEVDAKSVGAVFVYDPGHEKCTMCRIDQRACARLAFPMQDSRDAATVVFFVDGKPSLETRRIAQGFGGRYSLRERLEETPQDTIRRALLTHTMFRDFPEDDEEGPW